MYNFFPVRKHQQLTVSETGCNVARSDHTDHLEDVADDVQECNLEGGKPKVLDAVPVRK
jgi:hypothetical protein